jgi:hypothetical protein
MPASFTYRQLVIAEPGPYPLPHPLDRTGGRDRSENTRTEEKAAYL